MKNAFVVKNFFDYEEILPPPVNLPSGLETVYVTDNVETAKLVRELGWDKAYVTDRFKNITDKYERRLCVARINSFPGEFIEKPLQYKFVFVCDSNIERMYSEYKNFVNSCTEKHCLFVISGWYYGERDNIIAEGKASVEQERWNFFHESMLQRINFYVKYFIENRIDPMKVSVCSGKYFGWNMHHPKYNELSNELFKEYTINLQGNIVFSYLKEKFKNEVYECVQHQFTDWVIKTHKFQA